MRTILAKDGSIKQVVITKAEWVRIGQDNGWGDLNAWNIDLKVDFPILPGEEAEKHAGDAEVDFASRAFYARIKPLMETLRKSFPSVDGANGHYMMRGTPTKTYGGKSTMGLAGKIDDQHWSTTFTLEVPATEEELSSSDSRSQNAFVKRALDLANQVFAPLNCQVSYDNLRKVYLID